VLPDVREGNGHPPYEHGPAFGALARVSVVGPRALRAREAQMAASVVAVVLLFGVGVTANQRSHGCRRGVVTDIAQRDAIR
jgi:hypothetical protein